jgi:hypothetical protein
MLIVFNLENQNPPNPLERMVQSPTASDYSRGNQQVKSSNTILLDLRQKLQPSRGYLLPLPATPKRKMPEARAPKDRPQEKIEKLISPMKRQARWVDNLSSGNSRVDDLSPDDTQIVIPSFVENFLPQFIKVRKLFRERLNPKTEAEVWRALYALDDNEDLPGTVYLTKWVIPQKDLTVCHSFYYLCIFSRLTFLVSFKTRFPKLAKLSWPT